MRIAAVITVRIIFIFTLVSCHAQKGIYINKERGLELHISDDRFLLRWNDTRQDLGAYCRDTISYGYWIKVDKFPLIRLYSDSLQRASQVSINVVESVKAHDSIVFTITNPIESIISKRRRVNSQERLMQYSINVNADDSVKDCTSYNERIRNIKFNSNRFSIVKDRTCRITSFDVFIFPSRSITDTLVGSCGELVYTTEYNVADRNSNHFDLNISGLTPCFISARRINGSLALLDRKTIEFDGVIFVKK